MNPSIRSFIKAADARRAMWIVVGLLIALLALRVVYDQRLAQRPWKKISLGFWEKVRPEAGKPVSGGKVGVQVRTWSTAGHTAKCLPL